MKNQDKYDIFISYRRDGGVETARLFYDRLSNAGYRVSFDMETLRSGKFNTQLYERIEQCTDVIVLLSRDALNLRPEPEDDWLRLEIAHALKYKKNIIPVFLRDFVPPKKDSLPPDIADVVEYEAVTASDEHFDSTFSKLCSLLHSRPHGVYKARIIKSLLALLVLLLLCGGYSIYHFREQIFPYPFTQSAKQNFSAISANVQHQATVCNMLFQYHEELLNGAELALDTETDTAFLEEYNRFIHNWRRLDIEQCKPDASLLDLVQKTPVDSGDFSALYLFLENYYKDVRDDAEALKTMLKANTAISKSDIVKNIKLHKKIMKIEAEIYTVYIMAVFCKVSPAALDDFKTSVAPQWNMFPELSGSWLRDEEIIKNTIMQKTSVLENYIMELASYTGVQQGKLNTEAEEFYKKLIEAGATPEQAAQHLEKIKKLSAMKAQLEEQKKHMDDIYEKARKKFAPLPSDDLGILWGKALRFMSLQMPEEALKAVSVIRGKKSSKFSEPVCRAAETFIRQNGAGPFKSGVMVCFFESPATSHAIFKPGDIITGVNGKPCTKGSEYSRTVNNTYIIWRVNEKGNFESHKAVMPENQPRMAFVELSEELQ